MPSEESNVPRSEDGPLKILLVDDFVMNQRIIAYMLERQGHTVRVADSGPGAIAILDQESFHLVLMDIQMPEMDGVQATSIIREREAGTGRRTPIIAVSAHSMDREREESLSAAGMNGCISKPIDFDELETVIRAAIKC